MMATVLFTCSITGVKKIFVIEMRKAAVLQGCEEFTGGVLNQFIKLDDRESLQQLPQRVGQGAVKSHRNTSCLC